MASPMSGFRDGYTGFNDCVIKIITRFCMKTCIFRTRKYHFHISSIRSPSKEKFGRLLIFCGSTVENGKFWAAYVWKLMVSLWVLPKR